MSQGRSKASQYATDYNAAQSPIVRALQGSAVSDAKSFPNPDQFRREYLADFHPHEKQSELIRTLLILLRVIVVAGRRSGKTFGGGRAFMIRIAQDFARATANGNKWEPPTRITAATKPLLWYWCVAPTYPLGVYQRQELDEILGGFLDSDLVLRYVESEGRLWLKGGILIEFKSADNPLRLVGSGLNGVWIDEAARVKNDTWEENLEPTLLDKQGWLLVTTTPLGMNWVYDQLWERTQLGSKYDPDYHGIHFRTSDNTLLPHLVEETKKAKARLPRAVYLRNYEASFHAFEGKIYEDFLDDSTHVIPFVPFGRIVRRWAGVDWGFENPGVQIEIGQSINGRLYAYAEDYARQLTIAPPPRGGKADCWVNRFKSAAGRGVDTWWADPSDPTNIATCLDHGIQMFGADNSVNGGIDLVATLLKVVDGSPSLYIHAGLENLRRELTGYRWDDRGEKPVKENDHACDALRYGLFSEQKRGNGLIVIQRLQEEFSAFDMVA